MKHARNAAPGMLGVAQNVFASLGPVGKTVVGAATALVAATPFGAWAAVGDDVASLSADEVVEVGPYEIAIEKIVSTDALGEKVKPRDEANKLLVVVAEVENISDRPAYVAQLSDVVIAPAGAGIVDNGKPVDDDVPPGKRPGPSIYNIADTSSVKYINPDLTYSFALVWEYQGDVDLDELQLHLSGFQWIAEGESFAGLSDEYWLPLNEVIYSGAFEVTPPKSEAETESDTNSNAESEAATDESTTGGATTDESATAADPTQAPAQQPEATSAPEATP